MTAGARALGDHGGSYEIVRYAPSLKPQLIALQAGLWSPNRALNAAYFSWKYEQNPYGSDPLIYVALHAGRAVGMRSFSGLLWEAGNGGERHPALYADDAVIEPAHRNRGLMSQIMNAAFSDLAATGHRYLFNLSASPMTLVASLAMGWRSAGSVRPMRHDAHGGGAASRLRRLVAGPTASSWLRTVRTWRWRWVNRETLADIRPASRRGAASPIAVARVPRCLDMAELVERIGSRGKIRHVRDRAYLEWRLQNPLSQYRYLFWEERGLHGYLILQAYTSGFHGGGAVNIVDWEGDSEAVKAGLLQAAIALAGGRRLSIWSASLAAVETALLQRHGFHDEPQPAGVTQHPITILARSLRQADRMELSGLPITDAASWDLRMLYSMAG